MIEGDAQFSVVLVEHNRQGTQKVQNRYGAERIDTQLFLHVSPLQQERFQEGPGSFAVPRIAGMPV